MIYSSHLVGNSWLVQIESAVWVLNKTTWQIERRYPGVWINNTTLYGSLGFFKLSYLVPAPDTELLLHQNGRVTEFQIPRGHKLLAVHPDWLSFQNDEKKFSVVDHQGRELMPTLEQQSPKNCAPQVYDQLECASLNPLHAGWGHQFVDGTATWGIMNMGAYGKLNSTQAPWAQGLSLTKVGTERPMLSTGGYTNLEGGAVFSPLTGVLIYFPK
jgi:hypothetical protein